MAMKVEKDITVLLYVRLHKYCTICMEIRLTSSQP